MRKTTSASVGFALTMVGCCGVTKPVDIVEPSSITVENALGDIGRGLQKLRENAHSGGAKSQGFGLDLSDVTVTFDVAAGATNSAGGSAQLSVAIPKIPISGSIGGSNSATSDAHRSNSITLHFVNPAFAGSNTLIHDFVMASGTNGASNPSNSASLLGLLLQVADTHGDSNTAGTTAAIFTTLKKAAEK